MNIENVEIGGTHSIYFKFNPPSDRLIVRDVVLKLGFHIDEKVLLRDYLCALKHPIIGQDGKVWMDQDIGKPESLGRKFRSGFLRLVRIE